MASITAPDYPGERQMVCRSPVMARLRARKRATARRPPNVCSPRPARPSAAPASAARQHRNRDRRRVNKYKMANTSR